MVMPPGRVRRGPLRRALLPLFLLVPMTCTAGNISWPAEGAPPPAGDFFTYWIRAQIAAKGSAAGLPDDEAMVSALLLEPDSPYSRRRQETRFGLEGPVWSIALQDMTNAGHPMSSTKARNALAWDLGLYKALPRASPTSFDLERIRNPLARANLIKAGVAPDIFHKALHLVGNDYYAVAAQYAVAVQMLYERADLLPENKRERAGLRSSVLRNFMSAGNTHDMVDGDWDYLIRRLRGRMSGWPEGKTSIHGLRQITPALRVARVAAAYREFLGYEGRPPCNDSGTANRDIAALAVADRARELCTTDATDRAVYEWYRQRLAEQLIPLPSRTSPWPEDLVHVIDPVVRLKPFWRATFPEQANAHAAHAEVIALLLAQQRPGDRVFADATTDRIAENVSRHLCKAY